MTNPNSHKVAVIHFTYNAVKHQSVLKMQEKKPALRVRVCDSTARNSAF